MGPFKYWQGVERLNLWAETGLNAEVNLKGNVKLKSTQQKLK